MLILASASPRRAELLQQICVPFVVRPVDIDESVKSGESVNSYVERLSAEKARAVGTQLNKEIVLGADTTVSVQDRILGKPIDAAHFLEMMQLLSGANHQVISAVTVTDGRRARTAVSVTNVQFRVLKEDEIMNYWSTNEPKDKAGGYAIQGLGAAFVERIEGSYSGVMGLPLFETADILCDFGILSLHTLGATDIK